MSLKELVTFLSTTLVDLPEQVEVTEYRKNDVCIAEVRVAQHDLGRIIGKQGRTAKAIRTLLSLAAHRQGVNAKLDIIE